MVGGLSGPREPTVEEAALLVGMRNAVQGRVNLALVEFVPVQVRTQIVAGTNIFAKMRAGSVWVHLRVYVPLPGQGEPQLTAVQIHHHDAPIEYFESDGSF